MTIHRWGSRKFRSGTLYFGNCFDAPSERERERGGKDKQTDTHTDRDFYAPFEKGGILFCNCPSVCRLVVCRSVDQVLSAQYLLINTKLGSGVALNEWISRSHDQRSRSNHSSQPTVLSAQYHLTPSLDQYQTCSKGYPQ